VVTTNQKTELGSSHEEVLASVAKLPLGLLRYLHIILTLVTTKQKNHQVVWNPNTEKGRKVASGIYFYKLEADNHSQVKKMLILK
jgi:hypothetical protein